MTKFRKLGKRQNISLRRRLIIYYKRFVLLLKVLIVLLIALLLFTDLFKDSKDKVRSAFYQESAKYGFVLHDVTIEGQKNTSMQDIIDILGSDKVTPIFAINLGEVKERLETHIWVKSAIVERQLPSSIYIAVIERTPIAIWQFKQKLYLIDAEGNRIVKYTGDGFEDLIQVVGQDANIYAKTLIDDLHRWPALAEKIKAAVRYGNRRWNLILDQKITVKMPENDFGSAYDYLYSLYKNQKLFDQKYKTLDLRNADKFYLEKY